MAKVTLVPCSVNLTGKRDKVGHGEVTINNARIIHFKYLRVCVCLCQFLTIASLPLVEFQNQLLKLENIHVHTRNYSAF